MTKRYVVSIVITLLVFGVFSVYAVSKNREEAEHKANEVHWHSGFQIYIDNQLQDFSDYKYMEISPCNAETPDWEGKEQLEKAHLHDGNGDVVHVHNKKALWKDLFINMRFDLPTDKNVAMYVNGKKVENLLESPIVDDQSVVLFYGDNSEVEAKLANAVTLDRVHQVEKLSENCGASN